MVFLSITSTTWLMTAIGIGVVFAILVVLVLVLQVFTMVAKKTTAKVVDVKNDINDKKQAKAFEQASEMDKAAVAVALYLYYNDAHDHESGVLTRTHKASNWSGGLNPRF